MNLAFTNDFIVDGVTENVAFFVSKYITFGIFRLQPKAVGNLLHRWNSPVNETL